MELQEVTEVYEVNGENTVNGYLKKGWVLLNTVAEKEGDRGWFKYSLGWPKPLPAAHIHDY